MVKFTQKLIQNALVVAFIVGMTVSANAQFAGGSGSEADPWQISNKTEFDAMRTGGDWKYYILTADIDYENGTWEAYSSPNHGTQNRLSLDGDGHVISNMVITGGTRVGLFAEVAGYVKNLGFENITVNGGTAAAVGVIAAQVWDNDGRGFDNCYVVKSTITGNGGSVGALAGWMFAGKTLVKNCFADANVIGESGVGGLFGRLNIKLDPAGNKSVENCAFYGSITYNTDSTHNGGGAIAGDVFKNSNTEMTADLYYVATATGTEDQQGATAIAEADLAIQNSYPAFDFTTPVWKMGAEYAVLNWVEDAVSAIDTEEQMVSLSVYPNPATDVIRIKGNVDEVIIYSSTGALVKTVYDMNVINVEELSAGLYFVRINSGTEKQMQRVIIQ